MAGLRCGGRHGIGCGGYAIALVVYVLNKGHYHPLVRPAILASMFGYSLGGFSVLVDISRWWNFWHILWPTYFNFNSVMIEVALCISCYTTILMSGVRSGRGRETGWVDRPKPGQSF